MQSFRREQLVPLHDDAKDSHDPSEVSGMETLNFGRDNLIYLLTKKKNLFSFAFCMLTIND